MFCNCTELEVNYAPDLTIAWITQYIKTHTDVPVTGSTQNICNLIHF